MGRYLRFAAVAMNVLMDLMAKTADGVFTVAEMTDSFENAVRQIVPDLNEGDLARFGAITSKAELDAFPFMPGDILISIPGEMTDKLRITFEPE